MTYFDLHEFEDTAPLVGLPEPERMWTYNEVSVGSLACVLALCVPAFTQYRGLLVPRRVDERTRAELDRALRHLRQEQVQAMYGSLTLEDAFAPGSASGAYPTYETMNQVGRVVARLWQQELDVQIPESGYIAVLSASDDEAHGTTISVVRMT